MANKFLMVIYFLTLQIKARWESNINAWFPFMYSQKGNCAASLFPKQNCNVLSPNSYTHISVRDLYISRIGLCLFCCSQICGVDRSWEYINRSQTHECGNNWDWGRAIPQKGIHKWNFLGSVGILTGPIVQELKALITDQWQGGRFGLVLYIVHLQCTCYDCLLSSVLPGVPVLLAVLPLPGRAPQQDPRQLAHGGEFHRYSQVNGPLQR